MHRSSTQPENTDQRSPFQATPAAAHPCVSSSYCCQLGAAAGPAARQQYELPARIPLECVPLPRRSARSSGEARVKFGNRPWCDRWLGPCLLGSGRCCRQPKTAGSRASLARWSRPAAWQRRRSGANLRSKAWPAPDTREVSQVWGRAHTAHGTTISRSPAATIVASNIAILPERSVGFGRRRSLTVADCPPGRPPGRAAAV